MVVKISDNLSKINDTMMRAVRRAGRNPDEIKLIAVTKTVELKAIKEAVKAGVRFFGENYVQESEEKIKKIKLPSVKWHFIGHLQKNKAKIAAEQFDMIHSVDSFGLAKEINKRASAPVEILLQVKLVDEKTKGGVSPADVLELAREISGLKKIVLKGLMAIPPPQDDPERSRPYFTTLRRIAERINKEHIPNVNFTELSMGMSADYEVAIEEGATMIRIGTALFGERDEPKKGKK
ncbi:MAG: YggS family pyridoxal phosphate-dependent enzyme [Thermodesulfobacteriota bacterium]